MGKAKFTLATLYRQWFNWESIASRYMVDSKPQQMQLTSYFWSLIFRARKDYSSDNLLWTGGISGECGSAIQSSFEPGVWIALPISHGMVGDYFRCVVLRTGPVDPGCCNGGTRNLVLVLASLSFHFWEKPYRVLRYVRVFNVLRHHYCLRGIKQTPFGEARKSRKGIARKPTRNSKSG